MSRRRWRVLALAGAVFLTAAVGTGLAGVYPNPPHDFGPLAGARPLYNAANAATPRPLLVILVTFDDLPTPKGLTEAKSAARVFGPSFPNLAGYYAANSFGKMTFTPAAENCGSANDGVVTVDLGSAATYLARSEGAQDRAVLDAVNALGCVDFSKFDRNGDGKLTDAEVGFLAITSQALTCGSTRSIDSGAVYNGVAIDAGKRVSRGDAATNLLTLIHEVGHQTLDTDDLYGYGVGQFDLYGPTCGDPETTMFEFNAWQKLHLGWITPTVVDHDGYYNVRRADTTGDAFILYDPSRGTNDYFIVENREPTTNTYDQNATDKGLVIWRADDSKYRSPDQTVRPIEIMRPDGTTTPGCNSSNICYGGANGDAWDPSDPATPQRTMTRGWRDGAPSNVAVRAIGDAGNVMRVYFDVRGPGVLVDTYTLQHAPAATLTIGEAGAISFPVMNTGETTDTFAFTATGLPAGWTASTDTQTLPADLASTANIDVTPPIGTPAGLYTLTATGTSQSDSSVTSTSTFTVDVVRRPTTIVYTGDLTGDYHDHAHLTATLTDALSGTPLAGKTVDFDLGTQKTSQPTDPVGVAATTLVVDQTPAAVPVGASFAGDGNYLPSSDTTNTFTITKEETTVNYTGPTVVLAGSSNTTVSAKLVEDGANDNDGDGDAAAPSPPGQTITFTLGSDSCSAPTDASGSAACAIQEVSGSTLGPKTLTTTFSGDSDYVGSSDDDHVIVFAFPSSGAFALGNTTAATASPTTPIDWWSHSWSKLNDLPGGAPASFKGFAATVDTLPTQTPTNTCGATFTTGPGDSPSPPASVPSYMGVIVASSITKKAAHINGTWGEIVVVHTHPGYSPNPGHPGTGTIVAVFCS